jgi:hypothetical protein
MYYQCGYKYQTTRDYHIQTAIKADEDIELGFLSMTKDGYLTIRRGYAWDGASGPTWDTNNSMIGSLCHDALYQLIRMRKIDPEYKKLADKYLRDICVEDGMWKLRAEYWQWAVVRFGTGSCLPSHEPLELKAP